MKKRKIHGLWTPVEALMRSGLSKTLQFLLSDVMRYDEYYKSRPEIAKLLNVNKVYVSQMLHELEVRGFIECVGRMFNRKIYAPTEKSKELYSKKPTVVEDDEEDDTPSPESQIPAVQTLDLEEEKEIIQTINKQLGGKKAIKISQGRLLKLRRRLRTFTKDEILLAAEHLSYSPFHMGQNDNHMKYADYDFLLKSDERVEKWLYTDIQQSKIDDISRRVF